MSLLTLCEDRAGLKGRQMEEGQASGSFCSDLGRGGGASEAGAWEEGECSVSEQESLGLG